MRRFGALFFACHFNGTFNLPSLSDYVLRHTNNASQIGGKNNGALPNITGGYELICNGTGSGTRWYAYGAMYASSETVNVGSSGSSANGHALRFNASRSASVYTDGINYVRPKSMLVRHVVKYI